MHTPRSNTASLLTLLSLAFLTACGGGGGGSSDASNPPAAVTLGIDQVTLHGQAAWPDDGTLSVTIDDEPVILDGTSWTHALHLDEASERTLTITLLVDGEPVKQSEVTIRR